MYSPLSGDSVQQPLIIISNIGDLMQASRRQTVKAIAAFAWFSQASWATSSYPGKPIKLVIPFAPGGVSDAIARTLAERLSASLGQPVVVDHKPGGGSVVANEYVGRSPSDGYILLLGNSSLAINVALNKGRSIDPLRELTPISRIGAVTHILVAHQSLPVRTMPDLVVYAKKHPGALSYASVGIGSSPHIEMELLKSLASVDIVHVPYKGSGPAMSDLLEGRVQLMFDAVTSSKAHIQSGRLRALAVSSAARSPSVPNIPTIAESALPGYEASPWMGVFGPPNMPAEIVKRLETSLQETTRAPSVAASLLSNGVVAAPSGSLELREFLRVEIAKWEKLVEVSGVPKE